MRCNGSIQVVCHVGDHSRTPEIQTSTSGAVAQLGARVNGIHEVAGSIPASSTNLTAGEGHEAIGRRLFAPELIVALYSTSSL